MSKPQGLSGEEADLLLSRMESAAEISSEKELTPETWAETFDENNFIATPIGSVKMEETRSLNSLRKSVPRSSVWLVLHCLIRM